ncbi:MAG: DUF721 domain-containing protein [Acidobacteriaceae bacterium]|nr:DUF721 domain-containing protein [Acidobacteriaceae bacterium]
MERAARLIRNAKYRHDLIADDDIVRGIWPAVVGKPIARHTGRLRVVRATLVVEVEDAIWQRQLHALGHQIVERLQKLMGSAQIQDVEFRVGVPGRPPQRAQSSQSRAVLTDFQAGDEADMIQDPVLKKVYRLSRKRLSA